MICTSSSWIFIEYATATRIFKMFSFFLRCYNATRPRLVHQVILMSLRLPPCNLSPIGNWDTNPTPRRALQSWRRWPHRLAFGHPFIGQSVEHVLCSALVHGQMVTDKIGVAYQLLGFSLVQISCIPQQAISPIQKDEGNKSWQSSWNLTFVEGKKIFNTCISVYYSV